MFYLIILLLKEDRIINVNAATIILRGQEAKALSSKIKGICESLMSFRYGFAQCGNIPPLISHRVCELLMEADRTSSRHRIHYGGQNRPESVKSISDIFS